MSGSPSLDDELSKAMKNFGSKTSEASWLHGLQF